MARATPLPPAERREAILDAVLPLVLESGRDVSTRQIAEASGIAEGTIFRVFESKSALIDEAIRRGLSPEVVLHDLAALTVGGDLHSLVVAIVRTLQNHMRTSHRLLGLLPSQGHDGRHGHDPSGRRDFGERTIAAIATLLDAHADALRVRPNAAAGSVLALSFGSTFSNPPADPTGVADILLHGISTQDEA